MSGFTLKIRGVQRAPREYACPEHGAFELEVDLATSSTPRPCPTCATPSERTIEANIATKVAVSLASGRGKSEPPSPYALDTRPLAEGKETLKEFRARRRKLHRDQKRAASRQRGLI